MAQGELYFCRYNRRYAISLVDAYSAGFSHRILPTFGDIETEAENASKAYFNKQMQEPAGCGDSDTAYDEFEERAYEAAQAHAERVYSDLEFVRRQVTGLAVAGLYHLWERLLKEFLAREGAETKQWIFGADFEKLTKLLRQYGWEIQSQEFYPDLELLHLIANVVKHGDGRSCNRLLASAPNLFMDLGGPFLNNSRRADDLQLDQTHFDRFALPVRASFDRFPERLRRQSVAGNRAGPVRDGS